MGWLFSVHVYLYLCMYAQAAVLLIDYISLYIPYINAKLQTWRDYACFGVTLIRTLPYAQTQQ